MTRSFLSVSDISQQELGAILRMARDIKAKIKGRKKMNSLHDKAVGLLFEKPSTRTRTSFEVATVRLGGHAVYLASSELQLSRGR